MLEDDGRQSASANDDQQPNVCIVMMRASDPGPVYALGISWKAKQQYPVYVSPTVDEKEKNKRICTQIQIQT